ncbi:MAG: redox-sensing transcriptional repressor Rex [Oscillospiraceae bacterium]
MEKQISKQTLNRLPTYLSLLQEKEKENLKYISATEIAKILGLNHVQVRKDLSCASCAGRPKVGYETAVLIHDLEGFLGYNNSKDAIIVGAGGLGKTLLGYEGFNDYGLNIVAAFDVDETVCGTFVGEKPIFPLSRLSDMVKRMNIHIGIITTPKSAAQKTCDLLIECGVLAIWNFAPTTLQAPAHIIIQNENMAAGLAVLSNKLNKTL